MIVEMATFIQKDGCKVDNKLNEISRQPPLEDELPVVHVEEFHDHLNGAAFVQLVLLRHKQLLQQYLSLLGVDDPVALKGPDVHREVLEPLVVLVFLHHVLEIKVICVARERTLHLYYFIIELLFYFEGLLVYHLNCSEWQLLHVKQEVLLINQTWKNILNIITTVNR